MSVVLIGCGNTPTPTASPTAQSSPATQPSPTTLPSPPISANLPAAPKLLALPESADEQVKALVGAFAVQNADRPAAVLAAFARAGIPVVNTDGRSMTTAADDVVGIPWSLAWMTGTMPNAGARIPLSEVAALLTANWEGKGPDTATVANDLVTGLRAALADDPAGSHAAFVARLVQAEALAAREVDLASPDATADQIVVTPQTAALLVAAGLRAAVRTWQRKPTAAAGAVVLARYAVATEPDAGSRTAADIPPPDTATGCTPDGAGQWALWLGSKIAAGVPLVDVAEWDGIFVRLLKHVVEDLEALEYSSALDNLKSASTIAGYLTAALSALSLVLAFLTYTAEAHLVKGEPLERTKSSRDHGKPDHIEVRVFYDYKDAPPELVEAMNCVLMLLVAVGNNTTVPAPTAGGVEITVTGAKGFADRLITKGSYVLFGPETYLPKQTADGNGMVRVPVQGRVQKREIPKEARPKERKFSVLVEASADPVDGNTIGKAFLDDLVCVGGLLGVGSVLQKKAGCVDAIADIVRQFAWDLGEFSFDLRDWESDLHFGGTIHFEEVQRYGDRTNRLSGTAEVVLLVDDDSWELTTELDGGSTYSYDWDATAGNVGAGSDCDVGKCILPACKSHGTGPLVGAADFKQPPQGFLRAVGALGDDTLELQIAFALSCGGKTLGPYRLTCRDVQWLIAGFDDVANYRIDCPFEYDNTNYGPKKPFLSKGHGRIEGVLSPLDGPFPTRAP